MGNTFISGSCSRAHTETQGKNQQCFKSHCLRILTRMYRDITVKLASQKPLWGKNWLCLFCETWGCISFFLLEVIWNFMFIYSLQISLPLFLLSCEPSPCIYKIILWCFIHDIWSNDLEYSWPLHICNTSSKRSYLLHLFFAHNGSGSCS